MLSVSAMPKVRTQKYCSTKIHLFQSPPRLGAEVKAMAAYCRSRWKVSPGWPDWPDTDQRLVRCACAFISPPHNRNSDDKRMPHNKKQSLMIFSWWTALSSSRPKEVKTASLFLSLSSSRMMTNSRASATYRTDICHFITIDGGGGGKCAQTAVHAIHLVEFRECLDGCWLRLVSIHT